MTTLTKPAPGRRLASALGALAATAALTMAYAPAAEAATPPASLPGTAISLESSSCPSNMTEGASGTCVEALQELLNRYGANIAIDGSFGANTLNAVKAFQTQAGLGVDGQVGPSTKATLYGNAVLPLNLQSSLCPSNITQGASGACVQTLQGLLNLYGAGVSVDGSFGPGTLAAVKNFQSGAGLAADGQVGPNTKAALYAHGVAAPFSVSAASCPSNLVEGDAGACVADLQEMLDYYGAGLSVDGSFGPLTQTAVRNFQSKVGVGVDGQAGPQTKSALYDDLGGSISGPPPGGGSGCAVTDNCDPQGFADAILTYAGIGAPVTAANEYALEMWEREEGGGAGCPGQPLRTAPWANSPEGAGNPLNTTQHEPGSTPIYGDSGQNGGNPVQDYHDGNGQTCWYWGIKANGDVLKNGYYPQILSTLRNPSSSSYTQCVNLSSAVASSPWGTRGFSSLC